MIISKKAEVIPLSRNAGFRFAQKGKKEKANEKTKVKSKKRSILKCN
jgi:hypothetical protein